MVTDENGTVIEDTTKAEVTAEEVTEEEQALTTQDEENESWYQDDGPPQQDEAGTTEEAMDDDQNETIVLDPPVENGIESPAQQQQDEEEHIPVLLPSSNTSTTTAAASVSTDRKHRLLLEARADRLAWIQSVPLPYLTTDSHHDTNNDNDMATWTKDERISKLLSSHAARQLPHSALPILQCLYGSEMNVAERIEGLLKDDDWNESPNAIPSGMELLETAIMNNNTKNNNDDTTNILGPYHKFLTKLSTPACAMLVQGMRNFIRNFEDKIQTMEEDDDDDSKQQQQETLSLLATTLRTYLNNTLTSLKTHPVWIKEYMDQTSVRRSLESFLYGHLRDKLLVFSEEQREEETEWMDRMNGLQFVTPQHLEIACLTEEDTSTTPTQDDMKELLQGPIQSLLMVDRYHAPYEKLQCILKTYHGVNAALSAALNKSNSNNTTNKKKRLPSADDVLPTLILTVLLAKPSRLIANLSMVEVFCPSEQLRGEAGYAYTNLYGAVQFLRDLNLKDKQTEKSGLHISPEQFQKGLEECRAAAEERIKTRQKETTSSKQDTDVAELLLSTTTTTVLPEIPVSQVRTARLQGEDVGLEWALKWQEEQQQRNVCDGTNKNVPSAGEKGATNTDEESVLLPESSLPSGFARSYSFLNTRPEEVRVTDLTQLLTEYRMLVHTTEVLLAERAARVASQHKRHVSQARKALEEHAAAVDPNLVPK